MREFIEDHWGDVNAWALMLVGLGIAVFWSADTKLYTLGSSAFTAGLIALKLRHTPKNGNSNNKPPAPTA